MNLKSPVWLAISFTALSGLALAAPLRDDDDDERGERHEVGARPSLPPGVAITDDPAWQAECGSCHMAYPPGLLPARSWEVLLGDLGHHFGDDATVSDEVRDHLRAIASANAADVAPNRLSQQIARSTAGTTPLRITEIGPLMHEHGEIPRSFVVGNPEVRSLSNCAACHTGAKEGSFAESGIRIPGHGGWED